jgi:hypothetical protein
MSQTPASIKLQQQIRGQKLLLVADSADNVPESNMYRCTIVLVGRKNLTCNVEKEKITKKI